MKPNTKCFICKKLIYRIPSRLTDHNVCSYSCRNKYFAGVKSFRWKGGKRNKTRDRGIEKQRRLEYKLKAIKFMGGKCLKCEYNKCHASMDFHHVNPIEKDKSIKNIISGSWKRIEEELKKCILLCSNCHREHHYNEKRIR